MSVKRRLQDITEFIVKSLKVISGLVTLSRKSRYRTVYLADENVRGPINVVNTGGIIMYPSDPSAGYRLSILQESQSVTTDDESYFPHPSKHKTFV